MVREIRSGSNGAFNDIEGNSLDDKTIEHLREMLRYRNRDEVTDQA